MLHSYKCGKMRLERPLRDLTAKGLAVAAKSPSFTAKPPGSRLDGLLHPGPGLESCPGQIKTCKDPVNSGRMWLRSSFNAHVCYDLLLFAVSCGLPTL